MRLLGFLGILLVLYGVVTVLYHATMSITGNNLDDIGFFDVDPHRPITFLMQPLLGIAAAFVGCLMIVAGRRPQYA